MSSSISSADVLSSARGLVNFLNAATSPYHAVEAVCTRLSSSGFTQLKERDVWGLAKGGKYFFTRNQSSVIAFVVGKSYTAGTSPFVITGTHTDSPSMKLKLRSNIHKSGYQMVSVEPYGGAIQHTWFDRDLGVSGRVIVRTPAGKLEKKLVTIDEPILRIPTLAVHLERGVNTEGFKFNAEHQLNPILCTESAARVAKPTTDAKMPSLYSNGDAADHPSPLVDALCQTLGTGESTIVSMDLNLYDVQKATLGGLYKEFVFGARLDNLLSCYCALEGLLSSLDQGDEDIVRVCAMFNREEVGSLSLDGADSSLLPDTLRRIMSSLADGKDNAEDFSRAIARSFLMSADNAHAVHPNYADKASDTHKPMLNNGLVIKFNSNQKYATTDETLALTLELGKLSEQPLQVMMVRNDSPCGTTIGPISAAKLGIHCVDVGCPQLSMHSIREQAGTFDVASTVRVVSTLYSKFSVLNSLIEEA